MIEDFDTFAFNSFQQFNDNQKKAKTWCPRSHKQNESMMCAIYFKKKTMTGQVK